MPISTSADNYTTSDYTQMSSFPSAAQIYDEWTNKPFGGIPENYTYILASSALAQKLHVGDNITTMINFPTPKYWHTSSVYVTFSVNVDRQNLISPWNVETSISNVNKISDNIQNQILANYLADTYVNNM